MTGFGAAEGTAPTAAGPVSWRWELKSVNGRGLDIRCKLPPGHDALEPLLRQTAKPLARGNVSATLSLSVEGSTQPPVVDEQVLAQMLALISDLQIQVACSPPRPEGILGLKGVLRTVEGGIGAVGEADYDSAIVTGFEAAMNALDGRRRDEGAAMAQAVSVMLEEARQIVSAVKDVMGDAIAQHTEQLTDNITSLLQDHDIAPDRLAQEAAILASKADIREEVDRLVAHFDAADAALKEEGPIGRTLDFLAQELMREATTLTTKAPTVALKRQGLALKGIIDQLKEQVQNIL